MTTKVVMMLLLIASFISGIAFYFIQILDLYTFILIEIGSVILLAFNFKEFKTVKDKTYKKLMKEAEELYKGRQPQNALRVFEKVVKIRSNALEVYTGRIQCLRMLAKHEQALEVCNRAMEQYPEASQPYYLKGLTYLDMGVPREALVNFKKIKEIDQELAVVYFLKGQIQEKLGELYSALESYREYLKFDVPRKNEVEDIIKSIEERLCIAPEESCLAVEQIALEGSAAEKDVTPVEEPTTAMTGENKASETSPGEEKPQMECTQEEEIERIKQETLQESAEQVMVSKIDDIENQAGAEVSTEISLKPDEQHAVEPSEAWRAWGQEHGVEIDSTLVLPRDRKREVKLTPGQEANLAIIKSDFKEESMFAVLSRQDSDKEKKDSYQVVKLEATPGRMKVPGQDPSHETKAEEIKSLKEPVIKKPEEGKVDASANKAEMTVPWAKTEMPDLKMTADKKAPQEKSQKAGEKSQAPVPKHEKQLMDPAAKKDDIEADTKPESLEDIKLDTWEESSRKKRARTRRRFR